MPPASRAKLLVVSTGCPAGIGPEVSVRAATEFEGAKVVLVGDEHTLLEAAELQRISAKKLSIVQARLVR
jgi:4-hydroxythreonine-4-phosphate dehydrogenase